jgi:hypothetical protein
MRENTAKAFLEGLSEHGYQEDRDIAIEYRFANTVSEFPALAAE